MLKKLKNTIKKYWILGTLIVIFSTILGYIFLLPHLKAAAWFNDAWTYRVAITIGNTGSADGNKKVLLDIDTATLITAGKMQSDCGDSRFTDATGKVLSYYIDTAGGACNGGSTDYYVLMESIPNGSSIIYHYYGNSTVANGTEGSQFSHSTFSPTSGPTAATEEVGQAPIASWNFDEGGGTSTNDSMKGKVGTISGAVWKNKSECISGSCLYFDGSDDQVQLGDVAEYKIPTKTISFWAKPIAFSGAKIIFGSGGNWYVGVAATYRMFYSYTNTATSQTTGGSADNTVDLNQWHYYSYVYSVNGSTVDVSMYKDGKFLATNTLGTGYGTNYATNFTIGSLPGANFFQGYIDEIKIYPYARTAAQIKSDYHSRSGQGVSAQVGSDPKNTGETLTNGLIAYYPMDETTANTCAGGTNDTCDKSGNGYDSAWSGDATQAIGKYGNGVTFDGSEDKITTSYFVPNSQSTTLAAWINPDVVNLTNASVVAFYGSRGTIWINNGEVICRTWNYGTVDSGVILTPGVWAHVACTFDYENTKSNVYVNGVLKAYQNTFPDYLNSALTIGDDTSTASNEFDGTIDEVRIYNRALSAAEVAALYNYAPGPVAHWTLDENTGTTANDRSGNGYTGTLTNGPTWAKGKYGNAVEFDGSNDVIDVGTTVGNYTDNFTISAWMKTSTLGSRIIGRRIAAGSTQYDIHVRSTTGVLTFYDGTSNHVGTTAVNDGQWHHVTFVINGANSKIYRDGILEATFTPSISSISANTLIGAYNTSGSPSNPMYGSLDDIRIYNYALSQKQIVNVMNARTVTDPAIGSPVGHPVGYWKFDEGYGTTANDSSVNRYNATLSSEAWSNEGRFGKSLNAADTGAYADVTQNAALNPSDPYISVSAWVYPTEYNSSFYQPIVEGSGNLNNSNGYYLGFHSAGTSFRWRVGNGSTWDAEVSIDETEIPLNQWTYVVATLDATTANLYINGILKGSDTHTMTSLTWGAYPIRFGRLSYSTASSNSFRGYIDEAKIYNYTLTPAEVALDYNSGKSVLFGSTSTAANGTTTDSSSSRAYCMPGDTASCSPPVAEYLLDSGTGTTAQDTSGNANTGTLTSGPTWTNGKFGNALSFDGTDDYINLGSAANFSSYTTGTISGWFKINNSSSTYSLLGYSNGTGTQNILLIDVSSASKMRILIRPNAGELIDMTSTSAFLQLHNWYHFAYTSDSNGNSVYINGQKHDMTYTQGSTATQAFYNNITSPTYHYLGASYWSSALQRPLNGQLDQVRIYNYARTPAQIAWEYNRGAPVAWYRFDECQGTTAYNSARDGDNKSMGGNGTINIGASGTQTAAGTCTGASNEAWKDGATGKYGASLDFDGTDDNVTITNNSFAVGTSDFSYAFWMKMNNPSDSNNRIFSVGDANTFETWVNSSQLLASHGGDASANRSTATSSQALSPGVWYHVVAVYDRDVALYQYINGILEKTQSGITSYSGTSYSNSTGEIGGYAAGTAYNFDGQIDDVRFYNYALNPYQIKQIMNYGAVSFK